MTKTLIKGGRVLTMADGTKEIAADILVENGRIADIALWRSGHGALGNGQGVEFVFGHGGKALGPQVATGWRS